MVKVSSSTSVVHTVVSQFKNIELNERSINLAESNCQGMLNGKKANHEMKIKIQKFMDQTNKLAQQFNKVAGKKCIEDSLDAERFGDQVNNSERYELEERLSRIYREKNRNIENLDQSFFEVRRFDNQLLEKLYMMNSKGNKKLGMLSSKTEFIQSDTKKRLSNQAYQIEEDYNRERRSINDKLYGG